MRSGQNDLSDDIAFCSEWLEGPSIVAIKGNNYEYEYGKVTKDFGWQSHSRAQVFGVEKGLVHVITPNSSWVLPSNRAGWIPPNTPFKIRTNGVIAGWIVFILPEMCKALPDTPRVIAMSEVLRVLALRATEWERKDTLTEEQNHIAAIICNEIAHAPEESLHLPMPKSQRLVDVANAIVDDPSIIKTLDEWAEFGAMSSRTLRRTFLQETGLSFSRWRQQAQLAHGLVMLAKGASVTEIADELGYTSPSNFIAMFKKSFGETPGKYFSNL